MLNLGLNQEMEGKEADPSYPEYRIQPGVADLDNLELIALKRVAKSSWIPHFRMISSPTRIDLPVPSRHPAREHVEFPQQGPNAGQNNTREGSEVGRRSSGSGSAHSVGAVTDRLHSRLTFLWALGAGLSRRSGKPWPKRGQMDIWVRYSGSSGLVRVLGRARGQYLGTAVTTRPRELSV